MEHGFFEDVFPTENGNILFGPGWHGGSQTSPQGSFFLDGGADAADNKRALERLFRVIYR